MSTWIRHDRLMDEYPIPESSGKIRNPVRRSSRVAFAQQVSAATGRELDMADGVPETGKCFIQGDEVFFQGVFIRCGDRRDGMVHGLAAKRFFLAGVGERRGFLCNGASSSFPLLKSWMSLMKCSLK
ncbi:hypothetical protein NAI82_10295 [Oxalobacter sp. JAC-2022]|uniref:hypothetical protein n=1 Tax=Oxalobacter aliiformigenes TaxID=2946593 RepID=UPI0022AF47C6|nr:hypothetical protein [Oxalobacter aliiformigenes]MCZ4065814.1 hypothetical protein [Oxalobacter aliiformigenes]